MSRRAFLGGSAAGAGALAFGGPGALARRGASGATQAGSAQTGQAPTAIRDLPTFELDEVSIAELRDAMTEGQMTAVDITRLYLDRIEEVNLQGPELRAALQTNPDALELAAERDRERAAGQLRGPLHGIPVLLKDNIATADGMETTAGSLALLGARPDKDSFAAAGLRAAGAILLGKANLSEWANFRGDYVSSGWSARGGQCRNPYDLSRTPSGSSSGSAAAAAASLCAGPSGRRPRARSSRLRPPAAWSA